MTTIDLRQLALTRLLILNRDILMTPEALDKRIQEHLKGLKIDIPALKTLKGSRLEWLFEPRESGLYLKVVLEELPQLALRLDAAGDQKNELADLFVQDIKRVKEDQGRIVQRQIQAQNPAIDPFDHGQVAIIRRRLQRGNRGGEMLIPNGLEPEKYRHDDMPRVLPRCENLEVVVTVNWLSNKAAEVLVHSVVSLDGDGVSQLTRGTKIELRRDRRHRRKETGQRLQAAMDTKGRLKLKVLLTFLWAIGQTQHLELDEILEAIKEDPGVDRRA